MTENMLFYDLVIYVKFLNEFGVLRCYAKRIQFT